MKKKLLSGALSVIALVSFAGIALAAETTTGDSMHSGNAMPSSMMMMHPPAPMILTVSNDGMGRIRGVVASVSATSITIAGWGGVWTITPDSNATMLPVGSALSDIKVGDYVGAIGKVSEDTPSMTATVIRDWTAKHAMMHSDSMMGSTTGSMAH
ncbi:hypothetical protein HY090_03005 [Candidatus Kaiserbacteria bacterium]|nr:hypothetical protein [Candidatus Kaiserbacteria bacterium]